MDELREISDSFAFKTCMYVNHTLWKFACTREKYMIARLGYIFVSPQVHVC